MQSQPIAYNTSFKGDVYVLNKLSPKPQKCFNDKRNQIQTLIKDKQYDLYIFQDYKANKIRIAVSAIPTKRIEGLLAYEEISASANASRYFYAAKNAIDKHEKALSDKRIEAWEKEQEKKSDPTEDLLFVIFYAPFALISAIYYSIDPKWSGKLVNKCKKLLSKLGI